MARWQDRLTPVQRCLFPGCHLNRPIDELVAAGLDVQQVDTYFMKGPKVAGYMFEGVATKP